VDFMWLEDLHSTHERAKGCSVAGRRVADSHDRAILTALALRYASRSLTSAQSDLWRAQSQSHVAGNRSAADATIDPINSP